jgi:NHL repeat
LGNHRVCIFDEEGKPLTNLVGDAQVMSMWGQQSIDADTMKAYRRARNQERLWRFCFPTAVDFDPKTDRIIVADSQRNRLQIYQKVRDYIEFQAIL